MQKKKPTAEQERNLLTFWDIGQDEFDKYVDYYISTNICTSQKKRKLATFAEKKKPFLRR